MEISGRNHLKTWQRESYDYHFSNYGGIWGWATWKDAWDEYDAEMKLWKSDVVKNRIRDVIADDNQFQYQNRVFDKTKQGTIDTWDYQWGFAKNRNNALSVVPARNLVNNVGFDDSATHTKNHEHPLANKDTFELSFPLNHPPFVAPDRKYDERFHELRSPDSKSKRALTAIINKLGI